MREPYLVKKAREKRQAREWYIENVLKRSETERRLAALRDLVNHTATIKKETQNSLLPEPVNVGGERIARRDSRESAAAS